MNVAKFQKDLAAVDVHPGMARVLEAIPGSMTTAWVMTLLNAAAHYLGDGEIYCEAGPGKGATLVGALLGNDRQAVAIDNFSEFDEPPKFDILMDNLHRFGVRERVDFHREDILDFLADELIAPIGIFFYDAAHDYRTTLMALLMVERHLAPEALVVIDDWNFKHVKQAVWDWLAVTPGVSMVANFTTDKNGVQPWWNGLLVLAVRRDASPLPGWLPQRDEEVCRRIYGVRDGQ